MAKTADAWFHKSPTCGQIELRIFCFPYAGGSAQLFKKWVNLLPSTVQVVPVELPGRGARLHETPYVNIRPLIDDLGEAIQPLLDSPFAIFGHSMGAIIAFELARALRRKYDREPCALFLAGRRAPQIPREEPVTYNLPHDEFIEELIKLDGTPREVIAHAELMEIMIPLLRSDFQLVQTYEYFVDVPLRCPVVVYAGLDDRHITRETLLPWKEVTNSRFGLHMLQGDHFFIRSTPDQLLGSLNHELREIIAHSRANTA